MSQTHTSTRQLIINDSPVKNRQGLASDAGADILTANTAPTFLSGGGKVTTDFGGYDHGKSVTVQADGKIILGGYSQNGGNADFALTRYHTDGSLDTGFGGDGMVTTDFGGSGVGQSVTVQADGKILLGGSSYNGSDYDFALVRYNTNGSLDSTFNGVNTLNGNPQYTENSAAIVLDNTVQIYDDELSDRDNFNGASITLARHGGANNQDVLSGSGHLNLSASNAQLSGITIGTVSNHNGTLTIQFNGNATQARVNEALSSLAYSNTSDNPPTSVQIDWTFNDGNTGKQGAGGALKALGSTTVNIKPINDAPTFKTPSAINFIDSVFDDSFATVKGKLVANDAESSPLTYGIDGGTDNGNGTISKSSLYGVLTVTKLTGAYGFVANDAAIEALKANAGVGFTVTASDGVLRGSVTLAIKLTQKGATESVGKDTLIGTSANNKFDGLAGNDSINGLAGADTMKGGLGNDFYVVDNKGDVVLETSALATEMDTVNSSVTYTIKNYVENLALTGTAAINGTGNALNNILTGNAGANTLAGLAGNDVITGLAGADTMIGGLGNDSYVVDNIGDVVTEYSALVSEIDSVNSSVSYTLKANVEKLTLTGTAAINGTGNALNNVLTGNTGANILNGLAGNDIIDGLAGADTMAGGTGNDVYFVDNKGDVVTEFSTLATEIDKVNSAVSYTLLANVENLVLTGTAAINGTGNALDNVLTGNAAANTLNGGIGADMLIGGLGNDVYVVDNGADIVSETSTAASEIDRVDSSLSYTLKTNVENLTLTGMAAINGTGNTLANIITGNAGNNLLVGYEGIDTLKGGSGNDILNGVTGQDVLTGGAGFDAFRFSVAPTADNADVITDFVVTDDSIQLENAVFTQFITTGTLNAANFVKSDVALDLDDYVIYNPGTGALLYDADGNNTGAAVLIAVLGANLALTNGDIVVI